MMRKWLLVLVLILSVSLMYGCQQAATTAGGGGETLPEDAVPVEESGIFLDNQYLMINSILETMGSWIGEEDITGFGAGGVGASSAVISDPDADGWITITQVKGMTPYTSIEAFVKPTRSGGRVTKLELYGTATQIATSINGVSYLMLVTVGSGRTSPLTCDVAYSASGDPQSATFNGVASAVNSGALHGEGPGGTDSIYVCNINNAIENIRLTVGSGVTGTMTITWTLSVNGAAAVTQPVVVMTYNGNQVSWTYGGIPQDPFDL